MFRVFVEHHAQVTFGRIHGLSPPDLRASAEFELAAPGERSLSADRPASKATFASMLASEAEGLRVPQQDETSTE